MKGEGLLGPRPTAVSLSAAGFTSLHGKLRRTRGHWLWSGVSVNALHPPHAGELWLWPGLRVTGLHLPGTGLVCQAEAQLARLRVVSSTHAESAVLLLLGPASGSGSEDPGVACVPAPGSLVAVCLQWGHLSEEKGSHPDADVGSFVLYIQIFN